MSRAGRMEQEHLVLVFSLVYLMNTNFWLCGQILHYVHYLDLDRGHAKCCYIPTVDGKGLQKAGQRKDHCTFFLVSWMKPPLMEWQSVLVSAQKVCFHKHSVQDKHLWGLYRTEKRTQIKSEIVCCLVLSKVNCARRIWYLIKES